MEKVKKCLGGEGRWEERERERRDASVSPLSPQSTRLPILPSFVLPLVHPPPPSQVQSVDFGPWTPVILWNEMTHQHAPESSRCRATLQHAAIVLSTFSWTPSKGRSAQGLRKASHTSYKYRRQAVWIGGSVSSVILWNEATRHHAPVDASHRRNTRQ